MKRKAYVYAACGLLILSALFLTRDTPSHTANAPQNTEQVLALQKILPPQSIRNLDGQDSVTDLPSQLENEGAYGESVEEASPVQVNELDQDIEVQVQAALDAGLISNEQVDDFRKERLSLIALQTEENYLSSIDEFPES
jgi:hypothetical protein